MPISSGSDRRCLPLHSGRRELRGVCRGRGKPRRGREERGALCHAQKVPRGGKKVSGSPSASSAELGARLETLNKSVNI